MDASSRRRSGARSRAGAARTLARGGARRRAAAGPAEDEAVAPDEPLEPRWGSAKALVDPISSTQRPMVERKRVFMFVPMVRIGPRSPQSQCRRTNPGAACSGTARLTGRHRRKDNHSAGSSGRPARSGSAWGGPAHREFREGHPWGGLQEPRDRGAAEPGEIWQAEEKARALGVRLEPCGRRPDWCEQSHEAGPGQALARELEGRGRIDRERLFRAGRRDPHAGARERVLQPSSAGNACTA